MDTALHCPHCHHAWATLSQLEPPRNVTLPSLDFPGEATNPDLPVGERIADLLGDSGAGRLPPAMPGDPSTARVSAHRLPAGERIADLLGDSGMGQRPPSKPRDPSTARDPARGCRPFPVPLPSFSCAARQRQSGRVGAKERSRSWCGPSPLAPEEARPPRHRPMHDALLSLSNRCLGAFSRCGFGRLNTHSSVQNARSRDIARSSCVLDSRLRR